MIDPTFRRLVWKEYRLQRAFWISMVVLAWLLLAAVLLFASERDLAFRTMWLFDVALVCSALYALGCGATLFAAEHETGTYDFQRALPVSALRIFASKATFGVASTAAMIGLLWCSAAMLARGELPDAQTHTELWALWGLGAVEALVWGTFFSLLLRRPLAAALLAGAVGSICVGLITIIATPIMMGSGFPYHREPYVYSVPYQAAFTAIVALATVWLGHRWFREKTDSSPRHGHFGTGGTLTDESTVALSKLAPTGRSALGRLVWQHLRQSAVMLAVLSALVVPLLLTGIWASICAWTTVREPSVRGLAGYLPGLIMVNALVVAPLAGGCAFLGDQRRRGFRFLAEQGLEPGTIWLSRHLVWAGAILSWIVLTLPFFLAAMARHTRIHDVTSSAGYVLGFVILAYTAGQLCSMLFSSGILAGVMSVVLTAILFCWVGLMGLLDVPWLWSVAPIPLVLLLATRLRTPYWLLERNSLKAWRATVLTLAVPMVVIVASVCAYRVYSVPRVGPGFDPAEFARLAAPEARATAEMYRRALDLYVTPPREQEEGRGWHSPALKPDGPLSSVEITWLENNEATLRLVLEATERTACDFLDPTGRLIEGRSGAGFHDLGRLLATSARRLQSEGDLDGAFQRYVAALRFSGHLRQRAASPTMADSVERTVYDCLPDWAAHADQTAERIRAAISDLEKLTKDLPSPSDAIKSDYILVERIVAGEVDDDEVFRVFRLSPNDAFLLYAMQRLPWERARERRVMSLFTAHGLEMIDDVQSALDANRPPTLPDDRRTDDWKWHRLKRSTPLVNAVHNTRQLFLTAPKGIYGLMGSWRGNDLACELVRMETRRRAVRLQLALAGWRIEHAKLPNRLDVLVGSMLEAMPVDPYSVRPFEYFPTGKKDEVFAHGSHVGQIVSTPFFQSAGVRRRLKSGSDRDFVFTIPVDE